MALRSRRFLVVYVLLGLVGLLIGLWIVLTVIEGLVWTTAPWHAVLGAVTVVSIYPALGIWVLLDCITERQAALLGHEIIDRAQIGLEADSEALALFRSRKIDSI